MGQTSLPTYRAILRGNRLEWRGSARQPLPVDRPIAVYVTVLDEHISDAEGDRGARMAAALTRLAELHALAEIDDAVRWERETRQERVLPGRDE
jgi:hypothetical protein